MNAALVVHSLTWLLALVQRKIAALCFIFVSENSFSYLCKSTLRLFISTNIVYVIYVCRKRKFDDIRRASRSDYFCRT